MTSTFADLPISPASVRALKAMRIVEPTPVQACVIPHALVGRDVLGRAPTGSGKTLAFGLPLLHTVATGTSGRPRGLILAPTRELAEQIRRDLEPVAMACDRRLVAVYGGAASGPQIAALANGSGRDVVIATPGRLLDLIDRGVLALDSVDRVVVDEADRMADMGFLPDVCSLLDRTCPTRQTVLFSATLDDAVAVLTQRYQHDPVRCTFGPDEPDIASVTHRFVRVKGPDKVALAAAMIDAHGSTMVFCRTRHGVDRVSRQLRRFGIRTGWIHGGRSQNQRDAALAAFVDGRVQALIATDVAARGIHVDQVACVLHFDPPADAKDYVHRSGRTARAGAAGAVVTFATGDQTKKLSRLVEEIGLVAAFERASETPAPTPDRPATPPAHSEAPSARTSRPDRSRRPRRKEAGAGDGWESSTAGRRRPAAGSSRPDGRPKRRSTKRSGRPRPKNKRRNPRA